MVVSRWFDPTRAYQPVTDDGGLGEPPVALVATVTSVGLQRLVNARREHL